MTFRGTWSANTAPVVDPVTGIRRPRISSASVPTLTATISSLAWPVSVPVGSAISVQSAPVSSAARAAINGNAASVSVPDSRCAVISPVA